VPDTALFTGDGRALASAVRRVATALQHSLGERHELEEMLLCSQIGSGALPLGQLLSYGLRSAVVAGAAHPAVGLASEGSAGG
jgi:hypothetical protein